MKCKKLGGVVFVRFLKWLDESFEEWFMGIMLIGISLILMLQIIMRTVGSSLAWAEEIARYFYVWSVFLSVGYTLRVNNILKVELLMDYLPSGLRRVLDALLNALNVVLFAFFAYHSVDVVQKVEISGQTSPALEIPMYLVYAIIPVGFALASFRSLQRIFIDLSGKDGHASDPSNAA